jgi:hypothetical protein
VISFTLRPLYPQKYALGIYWIKGWEGPKDGLVAVLKRKIPAVTGN